MKIKRLRYFPILVAIILLPTLFLISSCKHDLYPADQMPALYFTDVSSTFAKCATCHNGDGKNGELDFSTRDKIISSGAVVEFNSSKSKAYNAMISTFQIMPPNGALSTNLRTKVRVWIDQGAKEKP